MFTPSDIVVLDFPGVTGIKLLICASTSRKRYTAYHGRQGSLLSRPHPSGLMGRPKEMAMNKRLLPIGIQTFREIHERDVLLR